MKTVVVSFISMLVSSAIATGCWNYLLVPSMDGRLPVLQFWQVIVLGAVLRLLTWPVKAGGNGNA